MIQIGKIIKRVPIFRMLGKESIDFIVERLKFKTFQKDDAICKIGDPGEEMYIIISGETDVRIGEPGSERVVATLKSGDYFGEMALLTEEPRSATVLATDTVETFVLYKNDFDVILERYPSISLSMTKMISQRLRDTNIKAAKMPKPEDIKQDGTGPKGSLKDMALVDLISFCEANSLTGSMKLVNGAETGHFEFQRGQIASVKLGAIKEDEALDKMLGWEDGDFEITVKPLKLGKDEVDDDVEIETKNVLIVNNSMVVRKVIERAFKGLGYNVETASNIENALQSFQSQQPDIIISDVKLADGNGVVFINKVREQYKLPFIFITDNSIKAEFEDQLRQLGNAELTKTHEVSEIVKLVENTLL